MTTKTTTTSTTPPLVVPAPVPRQDTTRRNIGWGIGLLALVAVHWVAVGSTDFYVERLVAGWSNIVSFFAEAVPPDLDWDTVIRPGLDGLLTTLWIGLLGTTFSVPFAIVLAMGAARTVTSNRLVYQACRSILSFLRAVPDIVFALILVTAVGLGPFAGVMALILHNTGVMGKLWAEAVEDTDQGPQTALRTAGASRLQQLAHATVPMSLPQIAGLLLYRFDVNVRSSLVLGSRRRRRDRAADQPVDQDLPVRRDVHLHHHGAHPRGARRPVLRLAATPAVGPLQHVRVE
jgi:phosphonate transport system permease protein